MLSVILVPIISAALLVVLYFLLSPGRKADALEGAQFHIKKALDMLSNAKKIDFKKLDAQVAKAQGGIQRAMLQDVYDVTVPMQKLDFARDVTRALALSAPDDSAKYVPVTAQTLSSAATYIAAYCSVPLASGKRISLKKFGKQSKIEQAEKFLRDLDIKQ